MTRTVISKSAKRKISSSVRVPMLIDGKMKEVDKPRTKAGTFTEQVVYKEKVNGVLRSKTRHEKVK